MVARKEGSTYGTGLRRGKHERVDHTLPAPRGALFEDEGLGRAKRILQARLVIEQTDRGGIRLFLDDEEVKVQQVMLEAAKCKPLVGDRNAR